MLREVGVDTMMYLQCIFLLFCLCILYYIMYFLLMCYMVNFVLSDCSRLYKHIATIRDKETELAQRHVHRR